MTESKTIPKSDTSTLGEKGQTTIPKEHREFLDAETGDHISWTAKEDGNSRYLMVKKVILPALAMLVCSLAFVLASGQAYAQQVTTTPTTTTPPSSSTTPAPTANTLSTTNGTTTTTVTNSPSVATPQASLFDIPTVETLPLGADISHLPLRIEFTYPAGITDIWNVSRLSTSTSYHVDELVGQNGITTKTFTTDSIDTFTILFGQKYTAPTNQIALVTVYSNTSQVIPGWVIRIDNNQFEKAIKFTTSPQPHQLTAEEAAAPVLTKLGELTDKANANSNKLDLISINTGLLSGWISGGFGLHVISAIFLFGAVIIIFSLKRQLQTYFYRPAHTRQQPTNKGEQAQ